MNTRLTCRTLIISLTLSSSFVWGQSNTSVGEIDLPSFERLGRYVNLDFFYTNDFISNTGGEKAGPRNIGALDLYLESDLGKYSRFDGNLMIHFTHINKNDTRGAIADTQMASNVDMPDQTDRLTDLYYEQNWNEDSSTLVGIHDISMEFNVTEASLNFLNGGFGTDTAFAVSGAHGPSIYPITTVGMRTKIQLNDQMKILAGVYDGDPGNENTWRRSSYEVGRNDGFMTIAEVSHASKDHKVGTGGWNYSKAQEKHLEDTGSATSYGIYGMYEQKIAKRTYALARFGWANPLVNIVQSNAVTGFVHRGIFQKKKNQDEVGIGYSRAHFSNNFIKAKELNAKAESVYELYYNFRPMKQIMLRPDLQYISNPSGVSRNDAWATGFRTVVEI